MNNQIWKKIENKKPRVVNTYKEGLKNSLSEFGRTTKDFAKFGAFYELYLYGFVIGYHNNQRHDDIENQELDTFNMITEWKSETQSLFKNIISVLVCNDSVRNEIGLDFYDLSKCNEKELDSRIKSLITVFEEYANAGLKIIYNEFINNPDEFDHFMSLQILHEKYVNSSEETE